MSSHISGSAIIRQATDIAKEVLAVHADKIDREAIWPEVSMRALLDEGFGGLVVPTQYGGRGQGLLALAKVCAQLSKECASTGICYGMHCVGSSVISANATGSQKDDFLGPICAGKHITSLSLSEASTGIHFYYPETTLRSADGDHYVLSGEKMFVTNGGHANSYVVSAVDGPSDGPAGRFSCIIVPSNSMGLSWGKAWDGLGMRGNSSRSMTLRSVRVPRANLLGREGDHIWYIFNVITPYFLAAISATYLGIAESALEEAQKHVNRRRHVHAGGLAQQPVIQHRFGTLWGMLERTKRLVYGSAASFDAGEPDALPAIMAGKAEVGDAAVTIVNEALTLTGGKGYASNSKLSRHLRDVRAVHLMSPSTDLLRTWIGKSYLGIPYLAD